VLEPELYPVIADPGQVEQVLMNLAVNARDAMSRGGALTIETANVTLDAAYAERHHVKHPGRHVMIAVTDTGRGMPASELERIFEPFFTTKENGKGTGLGLSTVHGIVEQSGGHISVYSEVGHGTTFKVYLPIAVAENTPIATETERKTTTARGGSETVLLVEDDAVLRTMASSILRRAGYMVIEASDGLDALRIAGDSSVGIDLVVSDMVMPAMGGRDLATHLERIRPRLPTLLMSGYTRDAMVHSADLGTASWFLEKPFTPDTLTRKVREVLDRAV
jgi:CheY-like chemotaxis protein